MTKLMLAAITAALVWGLYILNQPEVQQALSNLYHGALNT